MHSKEECVAYFMGEDGFKRLMRGLYDMFSRYERCYGAVRLLHPTPEEEKAISEFFNKDYYDQALIRIGLAEFERQMQRVLQTDVRLDEVLEACFHKKVIKHTAPKTESAFSIFMDSEFIPRYAGTVAESWLKEVSIRLKRAYRLLTVVYETDPAGVESMLTTVCNAVVRLPDEPQSIISLRDFALESVGDAHQLDMTGECGQWFLRALAHKFSVNYPSSPEECCGLYYRAGLLAEGVMSYVTVRGVRALRGDAPDAVTDVYADLNEAHMLTMENIVGYSQITAYGGRVFIVENLSVFSTIDARIKDHPFTMICASGGLNTAMTALLDALTQSGARLFYSGDMDHAGLFRADQFYRQWPKHFTPWRYDKADYNRIVSHNDFVVPLGKRDVGLYNEELAALLSLIQKKGKVGFQSALIEDLIHDIQA